jgi:hypothetical protein
VLTVTESLRGVSLFSALPPPEIAALADAAVARTFPKNTIVVTEGEPATRST